MNQGRGPGQVATGLGSRARKSEDESFATRKHKPQINNQKLKKINVKPLTLAESHSEQSYRRKCWCMKDSRMQELLGTLRRAPDMY